MSTPLRIFIEDPPTGVEWALQVGRDELAAPGKKTSRQICFTTEIRVAPGGGSRTPRLLGPAVQGPPAGRFIYLNSGIRAGQAGSPWDRRAKLPLKGITRSMIREVEARPGAALVARIAGKAKDGGPACASVPLLGAGWQVG